MRLKRIRILLIITAIAMLIVATGHAITGNSTGAGLPVSPLQSNSRTVPVYNLQGSGPGSTQALQPAELDYRLQ